MHFALKLLAVAGLASLAIGVDAGVKEAAKYPVPPGQCDTWIGIEVIYMVEVTEFYPEGSTVKELTTECVSTLTRSICATPAPNRPCYPCIFSQPAPADSTVTVTVTSCAASVQPTITVTIQLCSTCPPTTYTGTVPGYTPGGPCNGCSPWLPGWTTTLPGHNPPAVGSPSDGTAATVTVTATTSSSPSGEGGATTVVGETSVADDEGGSHTSVVTHHTSYHPTTTEPKEPVETAGAGARTGVWWGLMVAWAWVVGCVMMI